MTLKVKMIETGAGISEFQGLINEFIRDKNVREIRFNTMMETNFQTYHTAMILYEE